MSKWRLKEGRESERRVQVYTETLSKSGLGKAALVTVQPSSPKANFIRVYMAYTLSPVLGELIDWLFPKIPSRKDAQSTLIFGAKRSFFSR